MTAVRSRALTPRLLIVSTAVSLAAAGTAAWWVASRNSGPDPATAGIERVDLDSSFTLDGTGAEGDHAGHALPTLASLPDVNITLLDGTTRRLRPRPKVPMILNIWSSTCAPCVKELPVLARIRSAYGPKLEVLGIDSGESARDGSLFLERLRVDLPSATDPDQKLTADLAVSTLPSTFFVDADGSITHLHQGALDDATASELAADLAGPPPGAGG